MRPHTRNETAMRTMMTKYSPRRLGAASRAAGIVSLAFVGVAMSACNLDKTLKVQDVDNATAGSVVSQAALPVLYAGGLSDFAVSVNGTDASVTMPGLLGDELRDIDTFPTRIEVDQRKITVTAADGLQANNGTIQAWYRAMHQARASLKRALDGFKQFAPSDRRAAEMHALLGLDYIMFGEDYCNGVAYSDFADGKATFGGPNTTAQSFQLAVSQADSAIAIAPANSNEAYLAAIVKGRALLNLNQKAQAATAVAGVPLSFHYVVFNSENSGRENNGVYINVGPVSKRFGIADRDAPNTLPFRSMGWDDATSSGDPRVRWYRSGIGQDGQSAAYYTLKYINRSTSIEVGSGVEAKLIIAENLLATGNATWLDTLNALRNNVALLSGVPYTQAGQKAPVALGTLVDPGAQPAREDMFFQERALWLFLTGHRLGDLRREIKFYGRTAASVFPSGTYLGAAGGNIGTDVNFPVPIDEQNNPSAPKCTDRNP